MTPQLQPQGSDVLSIYRGDALEFSRFSPGDPSRFHEVAKYCPQKSHLAERRLWFDQPPC